MDLSVFCMPRLLYAPAMAMSWRDRTVLITGGTGFIGSFFAEKLLEAGARVRIPIRAKNYRSLSERRAEVDWMEGDLRDPGYCRELIAGVEYVFHLASCRRNWEYHHDKCSDVLNANLGMTPPLI